MKGQFLHPNSLARPSVSESQAETDPDALAALAELRCPRCRGLLTDPKGLGLCSACGYCRSLAETAPSQEGPAQSKGGLGTLGRVLGALPPWVWLVLIPVAAVLPICLAADRELPAGSPQRAVWGAAQFGLGLLALVAGQVWALLFLRRHQEAVEALDLLSPFKLWSLAFRWLPQTSGALALASGGLTAVLASLLWIGDLSTSLAREEPSRSDQQTGQEARRQADRKAASRKGADRLRRWELKSQKRQDPGGEETSPVKPVGTSRPPASSGESSPSRQVARCVVIGYILRGDGELASLVLATRRDDKLTDAGVVAVALGAELRAKLLARLADQRRPDPVVEGSTRLAVWVNPVVLCEVRHSGVDTNGRLIEPSLKEIAEE